HFPLLLDRVTRLAPWPVAWIDPAPAIARRVVDLLGPAETGPRAEPAAAHFTSGTASEALAKALSAFGIQAMAGWPASRQRPPSPLETRAPPPPWAGDDVRDPWPGLGAD